MRRKVRGQIVERPLDPGLVSGVGGSGEAALAEESAAEAVGGEQAVQVGASHQAIGADGAFGCLADEGERSVAIRTGRFAQMHVKAADRFAAALAARADSIRSCLAVVKTVSTASIPSPALVPAGPSSPCGSDTVLPSIW